jgi:hypothetical protein
LEEEEEEENGNIIDNYKNLLIQSDAVVLPTPVVFNPPQEEQDSPLDE